MADHVDARKRSAIMRAVRTKHTGPELLLRKVAHAMGLRYRLHVEDLPGKPDLVFPRWNTIIFVNGCFWHRHRNCRYATTPNSNVAFWTAKFRRNVERDVENIANLRKLGWKVVVLWQCELKSKSSAASKLERYFPTRRMKRAIRRSRH